jgi:hypothetical protein
VKTLYPTPKKALKIHKTKHKKEAPNPLKKRIGGKKGKKKKHCKQQQQQQRSNP